jgi:hypothetical protein
MKFEHGTDGIYFSWSIILNWKLSISFNRLNKWHPACVQFNPNGIKLFKLAAQNAIALTFLFHAGDSGACSHSLIAILIDSKETIMTKYAFARYADPLIYIKEMCVSRHMLIMSLRIKNK